jgi:phosphoribosylaminoimidazole-succinocarboxamide synthase
MQFGPKIAEGKTKVLYAVPGKPDEAFVKNKDDITSGDGVRHDVLPGKGAIACETTANCFKLLEANGIETHFVAHPAPDVMIVKKCKMIPLECVARRIATGHYLERNKSVKEGTVFPSLVTEFFLKDDARHDPIVTKKEIREAEIANEIDVDDMEKTLKQVFLILEKAWRAQGITLVDLKLEFGRLPGGALVVADVIDNDSWRLWPGGKKEGMLDKQVYRNAKQVTPEILKQVKANYAKVAEMTKNFLE